MFKGGLKGQTKHFEGNAKQDAGIHACYCPFFSKMTLLGKLFISVWGHGGKNLSPGFSVCSVMGLELLPQPAQPSKDVSLHHGQQEARRLGPPSHKQCNESRWESWALTRVSTRHAASTKTWLPNGFHLLSNCGFGTA